MQQDGVLPGCPLSNTVYVFGLIHLQTKVVYPKSFTMKIVLTGSTYFRNCLPCHIAVCKCFGKLSSSPSRIVIRIFNHLIWISVLSLLVLLFVTYSHLHHITLDIMCMCKCIIVTHNCSFQLAAFLFRQSISGNPSFYTV